VTTIAEIQRHMPQINDSIRACIVRLAGIGAWVHSSHLVGPRLQPLTKLNHHGYLKQKAKFFICKLGPQFKYWNPRFKMLLFKGRAKYLGSSNLNQVQYPYITVPNQCFFFEIHSYNRGQCLTLDFGGTIRLWSRL
jgi:hypothetical protein